MGQLPASVDVADAVQPRQARDLLGVVDVEVRPRLQVDGVHADVGGPRPPSDSDQHLVAPDLVLPDGEHHLAGLAPGGGHRVPQPHVHTRGPQ
ncbi:hypothetical protein U6N30_06620 [Blastococcus brunescens]|uniref:Uncharacterized protein n=1 Tax=Blastococcus brunescens TaxID=1564165 RepID=A0ABZ1BBL8_9ACTN|nr:hypothetical protein [Blastococcus sp. BMG 8361]WRL67351.1 hypothetical protein U6N30_06620 [Blastococcus sp. BMG 8361]